MSLRQLANLYLTRSWWRHRDFPLYVSVWLGTTAWLLSVTMSLEDPGFALVLLSLNTLGCLCSFGLLLLSKETPPQESERWLGTSIYLRAILFALVIMPGFAGIPPFSLLFPDSAEGSSEFMTGVLFSWGHVLYGFTMVHPGLLLMSAVPGFSMFGLMSTMNVNPSLMVAFIFFILSYLYALCHITFWREMTHLSPPSPGFRWPPWEARIVGDHFLVATSLLASLTLVALGLTPVLQRLSPRLIPMTVLTSRLQDEFYQAASNYAGFLREFRVGTGPITLSERAVMTVKTDAAEDILLLRGSVYDVYTGHGWEQTLTQRQQVAGEQGRFSVEYNRARVQAWAQRPETVQQIETLISMPSVLFGQAEPVAIEFAGSSRTVLVNSYGCLSSLLNLRKGTRYLVTSAVPRYPESELRQSTGPYPSLIQQRYLSLPMGLDTLREITQQVVANAATPYDKALAIRQYLETHCVYGDAPHIPWGEDVATYFVTVSKKGVCDLFATAMAVMARAAGIPARVATGFMAQQYDSSSQLFIVREKDAHAWAELYLAGYGWIPFDPQAEEADTLVAAVSSWLNQGRGFRPTLKKIALWALLLGLTAWLLTHTQGWVLPSWKAWRWWRQQRRTPRGQIVETYAQMQRLLARRGHQRAASETPREFLERLQQQESSDWLTSCEALTGLFHLARYSPHSPTAGDVEHAHQHLRQIRVGLRGRR